MNSKKRNALQQAACQIRLNIVRSLFAAQSGHPGGSLSSADILTYLYNEEMRHKSDDPKWEDRDRFVLSKGHAAPVVYATLVQQGYFSDTELDSLRHTDSMLQGHPDMKGTPGVDMSTGSLGQGISASCGMALAGKLQGKDYRVYALMGDGEMEEGQVWEAAMFAAKSKLDNLCGIVDYNGLQIDGPISEVGGPEPIDEKFAAFGWNVILANAHDFEELEAAFAKAKETKGKPSVIVAKSTKGKGVSFMENQVGWHGKAPNAEEYEKAKGELEAQLEQIKGEVQ